MRIISSFRDYYDQHDYAEEDDIYVRETKTIVEGDRPTKHFRNGIGVRIDKLIIGFCGEIFPLIKMEIEDRNSYKIRDKFLYTREDFKKHDKYEDDDIIQYGGIYTNGGPAAFFEKDFSSHKEDFIKYGVPCFIKRIEEFRGDQVTMFELNPKLIDYKFGKMKDAQTAYQDIDMFISGVLGNREVMVEIDDKHRIQAHGYNEESFRMPKGRKKPRRKNKN